MATIAYTTGTNGSSFKLVTWADLSTGDDGNPWEIGQDDASNAFVQATGTFNGGTDMALEGSNDGTNWVELVDDTGTAISLTAAGGVNFRTAARYIRPNVTSGSSDSVTVTVCLRG